MTHELFDQGPLETGIFTFSNVFVFFETSLEDIRKDEEILVYSGFERSAFWISQVRFVCRRMTRSSLTTMIDPSKYLFSGVFTRKIFFL